MGTLWYDSRKTSALASFDNGIVYSGDGLFRQEIGRYDSDGVYDRFGTQIAKFRGNTAYSPYHFSTEALCTSDSSRIYKGGSTWNSTLATYDGDSYGACAAAIFYFALYSSEKVDNNITSASLSQMYDDVTSTYSGYTGKIETRNSIVAIAILVVGVVATIIFYFTSWGHSMIFGEEAGRQAFFMSIMCSLVSFFIISRRKTDNFADIAIMAANCYIFVYIGILVLAIIDCANQNRISFGNVLLLLFGSVLGTVGVASPFCLIEIVAIFILKQTKKDKS